MTGARPRRLFHLVDASRAGELARALGGAGPWAPASLGSEGFVHLSFAEQIPATLARHLDRAPAALLLEVELADAGALRVERPAAPAPTGSGPAHAAGERFPHLYRALAASELVRGWRVERGSAGWAPPRLAPDARDDRPPGRPPASLLGGAPA